MKSILFNIAALALFSAFASAAGLLSEQSFLFQIAAQWLVNELWFDACLVPALLMQLFGRRGEGQEKRRLGRAARWTCFCLLLIPAMLFGLLSLVESITSHALGNGLGLPLGVGLYACSFGGFALLFILSLVAGATPLSVQAALENLMDGKLEEAVDGLRAEAARSASAAATRPLPAAACAPGSIPTSHSPAYAAHERDFARKLQAGEGLILSTAPAGVVPMRGEGQSVLVGCGFGAAGLFLLYNAHGWQQGGNLPEAALWALLAMGVAFLLLALPVLAAPLRWRWKLRSIDYFITDRRLFIYRGEEVFIHSWAEPCACYLSLRAGTRGDVAVIRKGIGYHLLRGFFKRWAGLNEEETRRSFDKGSFDNGKDMQTQALINVEGAQAIHELICGLLNPATASDAVEEGEP